MIESFCCILVVLSASFLVFYKFIFLRDNNNKIPLGNNIVSPASGRIVFFKKINPRKVDLKIKKGFLGHIKTKGFLDKEYYLVSIFMNVYNVHFTKMPCDGKLLEVIRRPGKFLPVMSLKNAIENEKQEFILDTSYGTVKVIQIAGFLARRCVSFIHVGDSLEKGAKLGQILLGSQVTLLLPADNLKPKVINGSKVSAGETVLFAVKVKNDKTN